MKISKRIMISLTVSVLLSVSVFGGCTKTEPVTNNESTNKPTLKQLMIYSKEDYNTTPVAAMLEEKTGYKVVYEQLPQDRAEDKLNLLLASGESYDLVTVGGNNQMLYTQYARQGALLELENLIEKYGPNILKAVTKESFDGMRVDGRLYAIGTGGDAIREGFKGNIDSQLIVRKDVMDRIGAKAPDTLSEFTALLQKFKNDDPLGRGSKNAPLVIGGTSVKIPMLQSAFGIYNEWNDVDGTLVHTVEMPKYVEYLKYMRELFEKGLLDNEFPTNKGATVTEKFANGDSFVAPMTWASAGTLDDALKKKFPNASFEYLLPLIGSDGKRLIGSEYGGYDKITFVPKTTKHAEDVIKYLNLKLDDNIFKEMVIGIEGVHHTVENGEYFPILPTFFDERNISGNFLSGANPNVYSVYWKARVRKDDRVYNAYKSSNEDMQEYFLPNAAGGAPALPERAKNSQVLTQQLNDFSVRVVVGTEPISAYESFLAKWKAEGGDNMTEEINQWYLTKKSN